jgi:hypothetical protein
MSKIYKTANGKSIDMDNLRLANEDTIAVGNMHVNARGDQLGPGGVVVQGRNAVMDQYYRVNGSIAADVENIIQQQVEAGASVTQGVAASTVVTEHIPENVDADGVPFDDIESPVKPVEPAMRGSLADSIARQVLVKQDLVTPPQKPKGPSRI